MVTSLLFYSSDDEAITELALSCVVGKRRFHRPSRQRQQKLLIAFCHNFPLKRSIILSSVSNHLCPLFWMLIKINDSASELFRFVTITERYGLWSKHRTDRAGIRGNHRTMHPGKLVGFRRQYQFHEPIFVIGNNANISMDHKLHYFIGTRTGLTKFHTIAHTKLLR